MRARGSIHSTPFVTLRRRFSRWPEAFGSVSEVPVLMGPLSRDELAALIAAGEDSFTEFKAPETSIGISRRSFVHSATPQAVEC